MCALVLVVVYLVGVWFTPQAARAQNSVEVRGVYRVNTFPTGFKQDPVSASDKEGRYVVVWESFGQDTDSDGDSGVFGQLYDRTGVKRGGEFRVSDQIVNDQENPDVDMNGNGSYVIVWSGRDIETGRKSIYAQIYSSSGAKFGENIQVTLPGAFFARDSPSVSMYENGDFVVAWVSTGQDFVQGGGVYARKYSAEGEVLSEILLVNETVIDSQEAPRVEVVNNDRVFIVWQSENQDGDFFGIYAKIYDSDMNVVKGEFQISEFEDGSQRDPQISSFEKRVVIVWTSGVSQDGNGNGVYGKLIDIDGDVIKGEFLINTSTAFNQWQPAVSMGPGGDFVVAWVSSAPDTGIYMQRLYADGSRRGVEEFPVHGNGRDPTLAVGAGGGFSLVWAQPAISGQLYTADVFTYDAATLTTSQEDRSRVVEWTDSSPNDLNASVRRPGPQSPLFLASVADLGGEPAVYFDGRTDRLAIPQSTALFGENQPEKSLALVFRTGNEVQSRQVIAELGGAESGINVYLDGGKLYVGGWSQAGNPSDWGPVFFDTAVAPRAAYVLVVSHRRNSGNSPGRFEAYVNGSPIGLNRPGPNAFATTSDNAGIGAITGTTRFHDRASSVGEKANSRVLLGYVRHRNDFLGPREVESLTAHLATRFGLVAANDRPPSASVFPQAEPSRLEVYPNPATRRAVIRYSLLREATVRLTVYDTLGRRVALLADEQSQEGAHVLDLGGLSVAPGVYLVRMEVDGVATTERITVLR